MYLPLQRIKSTISTEEDDESQLYHDCDLQVRPVLEKFLYLAEWQKAVELYFRINKEQ